MAGTEFGRDKFEPQPREAGIVRSIAGNRAAATAASGILFAAGIVGVNDALIRGGQISKSVSNLEQTDHKLWQASGHLDAAVADLIPQRYETGVRRNPDPLRASSELDSVLREELPQLPKTAQQELGVSVVQEVIGEVRSQLPLVNDITTDRGKPVTAHYFDRQISILRDAGKAVDVEISYVEDKIAKESGSIGLARVEFVYSMATFLAGLAGMYSSFNRKDKK